MDLTQLLRRCKEGDPAAIQGLVGAFKTPVYRLALLLLRDPAEADEASQDVLIAVCSNLATYRAEASFKTWLYAITLNICRGRLRKRQVRERLYRALENVFRWTSEPAVQPEQVVLRNESDRALWQAITRLGAKHYEVVVLRYYHELSLDEIAQVAGVSERTVRTRLHQAHARIRAMLVEIDWP